MLPPPGTILLYPVYIPATNETVYFKDRWARARFCAQSSFPTETKSIEWFHPDHPMPEIQP